MLNGRGESIPCLEHQLIKHILFFGAESDWIGEGVKLFCKFFFTVYFVSSPYFEIGGGEFEDFEANGMFTATLPLAPPPPPGGGLRGGRPPPCKCSPPPS